MEIVLQMDSHELTGWDSYLVMWPKYEEGEDPMILDDDDPTYEKERQQFPRQREVLVQGRGRG